MGSAADGRRLKVSYLVAAEEYLASYRLRVRIPAPHTGCDYAIAAGGDVVYMHKHYQDAVEAIDELQVPLVYDVVNDHFATEEFGSIYRDLCARARTIVVASQTMADRVREHIGRDTVIIPDPWENAEQAPHTLGNNVLWFGNEVNLPSLHAAIATIRDVPTHNFRMLTGEAWSLEAEAEQLAWSNIVLITGKPEASENRLVKAVRAGCYVVATDIPSYRAFAEVASIGNVRDGLDYALRRPRGTAEKVRAAQEMVREKYSPQTIGAQWGTVFRGACQ